MRVSKLLVILAAFFTTSVAWSAQLFLVNLDPPDSGLNDTTPVAPVPGNPGTTIGEQRVNVLLRAGEIWAQNLVSDVPITIQAQTALQDCDANGAILASAVVLLRLSGVDVTANVSTRARHVMLVAGVAAFMLVGVAVMGWTGTFLRYPPKWAGMLILAIEAAATLSITAALVTVYVGGTPATEGVRRRPDD